MNNTLLLYVLVVIFFISCGNDVPNKLPSSNQKKQKEQVIVETNDSVEELVLDLPFNIDSVQIIYSGGTDDDRNIVFVDKVNNDDYFKHLNQFAMPTKFEIDMYRDSYSLLIKDEQYSDTAVISLQNFPRYWLSVYYYNSEFYLYSPAREELNYRIAITDSTFKVFNSHGVVAEKISSFKKSADNYYIFNTIALSDSGNVYSKELNIYFIDDSYSVAIWEEFLPLGLNYRLMIPVDKAESLPVMVNFGEKSKPDEFVFDEMNYFEIISSVLE